jgi:sugar lactone lactonase YvrE
VTDDLRVLATGRGLVESPRWYDGRLYYSDWTAGEVLTLDGTVVATVTSLPLCTGFLPDGRLLIVDSPNGRVITPGGDVYAELGRPGWNDTAVTRTGLLYVNGMDWGNPGFIVVVTHGGAVRRVADDVLFPNGMVVTPDDSTLIVADSYRHQLVAFTIAADGSLSDRRVWADLGEGTPDGIDIDADGAVWYADVPNKWCRRVAEGGEVLRTVQLDRGGFACVLSKGAPGDGTLYITAAVWLGFSEPSPVEPGSGQVLAIDL